MVADSIAANVSAEARTIIADKDGGAASISPPMLLTPCEVSGLEAETGYRPEIERKRKARN